jgi:hypothetical protein
LNIAIGIACLYFVRDAARYRTRPSLKLWVFEEGILLQREGQLIAASWQEIDGFEVSYETGRPLYWLTLKDEDAIILSMGHRPEVVPLMEYVEIRMAAVQLLPRLKSIWSGELERFSDVAISADGIFGPELVARWSEVRGLSADEKWLYIHWKSERRRESIRYRDVSFPTLVMALARILIAEHTRMKWPNA